MPDLGSILACGVHVPRLRLPRALIAAETGWLNPPARNAPAGERAIANWDEDALTMAVTAARNCLVGRTAAPAGIAFCSTTAPFADRDDAVLVAAALDLPDTIATQNLCAALRAGTRAVLGARADDAWGSTLVVASDLRPTRVGSPQELAYGDAAAALLIGPAEAGELARLLGAVSRNADFVDHYRMSGIRFDYALEERWVRDEFLMKAVPQAIGEVLAGAGVNAAEVRHLAIPAAPGLARRIAQGCGLTAARCDERLWQHCGDAGVAMPLLEIVAALGRSEPGDLIVAVGLGQGVDALLLRAEAGAGRAAQALEAALARGREETSYVRYLSHRGLVDADFGMRAERDQRTAHTVAYRKRAAVTAFTGGRCERCGAVQFPMSRVCVNPACRATDTQRPHRLADSTGRVKTFTEDWQAFAPRPPYVYGNIEFAEGGNLLMEVTDVEPGELAVGDAVRFEFRIKDEDRARAFRRYFWKAIKS